MPDTILFIDDEDIVLRSCRRIFAREDIEIDTATSGEEGLDKARRRDYDVVVTDLKMPGLGGIDVLKALRKERPETIVIVFTGYANVETAREALKNGAFDYIPKPFTPEEIKDVVRNAFRARREKGPARMLDLMAIVSHELKSPLATVQTTADTLYRGYFGKLEPGQRKIVETILRNCEYLEDVIRSYIDLSKMEIDGLESFQKDIRLGADVIREVVEVPEVRDNLRRMPILTEITDDPPIHGDPQLLRIVVRNLVNNAVKYGRDETPVRIGLERRSGEIVLSVRNEGVGIAPEDIRNRLFKRFERLKQRGTEGVKGSGLGLYICRTIVEKHKGRIWAESEPGAWAAFFVALPLPGGADAPSV
ncbi:MAG: response regulator [Candidatus Aminicenantes bacterium]|nr:response regulator [Candidatus Aminicenantes bacterium]